MRQYGAAAATFGLVAGRALAGTGAWVADITTQDGDAIVEPGETATIRVSIDFDPGPEEIDPETGMSVMGFAGVWVDYLAADAWASGRVSMDFNPHLWPLVEPTIDPATQSVLGLSSFQYATGSFYPDDPIWVTDLHWDPLGDYSPRRAGVRADAQMARNLIPDDHFLVYEGDGPFIADLISWSLLPDRLTFEVVPSPGAIAFAPLGALCLACRRGAR